MYIWLIARHSFWFYRAWTDNKKMDSENLALAQEEATLTKIRNYLNTQKVKLWEPPYYDPEKKCACEVSFCIIDYGDLLWTKIFLVGKSPWVGDKCRQWGSASPASCFPGEPWLGVLPCGAPADHRLLLGSGTADAAAERSREARGQGQVQGEWRGHAQAPSV